MAVQTSPAMPCYLRARRAGSSACQADTRPGLKALEQKRKRSAMGRVRRQNMEPQVWDREADLLGGQAPLGKEGAQWKGGHSSDGEGLRAIQQALLREGQKLPQ